MPLNFRFALAALCALTACTSSTPFDAELFDKSTLIGLVETAPADGVSQASVQLTLRDNVGAPVVARTVNFIGDAGDAVVVQPGKTDERGQATAYISRSTPGPVAMRAEAFDRNAWVLVRPQAQVTFTDPNRADGLVALSWAADRPQTLVADGNALLTLTLSASTQGTGTVAGLPVVVRSSNASDTVLPKEGTLSSLGTFTSQVRATQAGPRTVVATVNGVSTAYAVTFVAGPLHGPSSALTVAPDSITADGASQAVLQVHASDALGNSVGNVRFVLSADDANTTLSASDLTTDAAGIASCTVVSTRVGTHKISASHEDVVLTRTVSALPRAPSGLYSKLEVPNRATQADGISQVPLSVTVLDTGKAPLANQWVRMTSTDPNDSFDPPEGVTDPNGLFGTWLTSQRSGAKTILALFGRATVGATATFVPLSADFSHSTWVAAVPQAAADGSSEVPVLLLARDMYGNPAAFEPVVVTASSANVVIRRNIGQTDSQGRYTAYMSAREAGDISAVVTLMATSMRTPVHFVAGAPSASQSALAVTPSTVLADGSSSATAAVSIKDAQGNGAAGAAIQFSASLAPAQFSAAAGVLAGDGTATSAVTSAVAGPALVTARSGQVSVSAPMLFVAGAPSAQRSRLQALPSVGLADTQSAIALVLRVRDAKDNPVVGSPVALTISPAGTTATVLSQVTGPDGTWIAQLTSGVAQAYEARVLVDGAQLTVPLSYVTAGANAAQSTFVASPGQLRADGVSASQLVLRVRDALGNPVVGQTVTFRSPGQGAGPVPPSRLTDHNGEAVTAVATTSAGIRTVSATLGSANLSAQVTFLPGAPAPGQSSVQSAAQGGGLAVANGQSPSTVTVALRDAAGNPVPYAPIDLASSVGSDVIASIALTTDAAGLFTATLTGTVAGPRIVTATAAGVAISGTATLVSGPPHASISTLTVSSNAAIADGTSPITITAMVRDAFGNPVVGQPLRFGVQGDGQRALNTAPDLLSATTGNAGADGSFAIVLRSTLAERKNLSVTAGDLLLTGNVVFVPGPPSPAHATLVAVPSTGVADGVTPIEVRLLLADVNGNPAGNQPVTVVTDVASDIWVGATQTTSPQGTWSSKLIASAVGVHRVSVTSGQAALSLLVPFVAGPVSPLSTLEVAPSQVTADGNALAQIRIVAADAQGNPAAGQNVVLAVTGLRTRLTPATGVTDGNGVFASSLASTWAGPMTVTATLGADGALQLAAPVTFVAGGVSAQGSQLRLSPSLGVADGVSVVVANVRVVDIHGNPLVGVPVDFISTAPGDVILPQASVTNGAGIITAELRFVAAGSRTVCAVVGGTSLNVPFVAVPGAATGLTSTLSASPGIVTADGQSPSRVVLRARDNQNNPAANQYVMLGLRGSGASLSRYGGSTDASGVFTADLIGVAAGSVVVEATVGTAMLSAPVTFVPGPASTATSTWIAQSQRVAADGVASTQLTLHVQDPWGNPLVGRTVTFFTAGGSYSFNPAGGTTDATGSLTTQFRSTLAGERLATASVDALTQSLPITFLPGSPNAQMSYFAAAPANLSTDVPSQAQVTLVARDALGNLIPGLTVMLGNTGVNTTLSPRIGATDAQGSFVATFSAVAPGSSTLKAFLGSPAQAMVTFDVVVAPGQPADATTTLAVSPQTLVADGNAFAQVTVRVADAHNNPVPGQAVQLSASGLPLQIDAAAGVADGNGLYVTTVRTTAAGSAELIAQVGTLTRSTPIVSVAGPATEATSSLLITAGAPDNTTPTVVRVLAQDAQNNRVVGLTVHASSSNGADRLQPASCITGPSGECSLSLVTGVAGTRTLTVALGNAGAPSLDSTFSLLAGAVSSATTTLSVTPAQAIADGITPLTVTLQVRDAAGNVKAMVPVTLAAQGPGVILDASQGTTDAQGIFVAHAKATQVSRKPIVASVGGASATGELTFVPGAIDANTSTWVSTLNPLVADGESSARLIVMAKDAWGNAVAGTAVSFAASGANMLLSPNTAITDAQGSAQTQLTTQQAQNTTLTATLGGVTLSQAVHAIAGAVAQAQSSLSAVPGAIIANGADTLSVCLRLRDGRNNPVSGTNITFTAPGSGVSLARQFGSSDGNGRVCATLSATRAQLLSIGASDGANLWNVPVQLLAGPAALAQSTFAVAPNVVLADGLSATTLQLVLADVQGNPVANAPVRFDSLTPGDALSPNMAVTDALGRAQASLRATTAGPRSLTAQAGNIQLAAAASFVPGAPTAQTATVSVSPNLLVADGSAQAIVTYRLTDALQNPIVGQNVSLAASGNQVTLDASSGVTDAQGRWQTTVTATRAQAVTLSAAAGGLVSVTQVVFVPGAANSAASSLTLAPAVGLADNATPVQATLVLRDSFNNPLPGANVIFAALSPNGTFAPNPVTTDAVGMAKSQLVSSRVGTLGVTASGGNVSLMGNVAFAAGAVSASRSQVSINPPYAIADGATPLQVALQALDRNGNPVAMLPCVWSAPGLGATFVPPSSSTDANGLCAASMTATVANSGRVLAAVGGTSIAANVTLSPGAPDGNTVHLTATPNTLLADGASTAAISVAVFDRYANPVPQAQVAFAAAGTDIHLGQTQATTDPWGIARTTVASGVAQVLRLTATITAGSSTVVANANVVTVPGPASGISSQLATSPNAAVANGASPIAMTLFLADAQNNPIAGAAVTFASQGPGIVVQPDHGTTDAQGHCVAQAVGTVAGQATLSAQAQGITASRNVQFLPGAIDANTSTLLSSVDPLVADGESTTQIIVVAKDALGNVVPGASVTFSGTVPGLAFMPGQAVTDADGTAVVLMSSTAAGPGAVTAVFAGATLQQNLTLVPGAVSAVRSTLVASPNSVVADGNTAATLTLTLLDGHDNPVASEPVTLTAQGAALTLGAASGSTGPDGRWSTSLTSHRAQAAVVLAQAGTSQVRATVVFVPGAADANASTLTALPDIAVADGTAAVALRLQLADAAGNPLINAPVHIASDNPSDVVSPADTSTDSLGQATASARTTVAGSKIFTASAAGLQITAQANFVAGVSDGSWATLVASPNQPVADGVAATTVVFHIGDKFMNPIVGQAVSLTATGSQNTLGQTSGVTDAQGLWTTTLSSSRAEAKVLTAVAGALVSSTSVVFVPGSPNAAASSLALAPSTGLADGNTFVTAHLVVRDGAQNPVVGLPVVFSAQGPNAVLSATGATTDAQGSAQTQLTSISAGLQGVTASAGGLSLSGQVPFVAGPFNVAASSLVASPNVVTADGTAAMSLVLRAADRFGNPIVGQSCVWTAPPLPVNFAPASAVTDSQGICRTQATGRTAGTTRVMATLGGTSIRRMVAFVAGAPAAEGMALTASPNALVADGTSQSVVSLRMTDAFGNAVPAAQVQFTTSSLQISVASPNAVTDAMGLVSTTVSSAVAIAGRITATYVPPADGQAPPFVLTQRSGGAGSGTAAVASSANVVFFAGPAVATTSTLSGSPNQRIADGQSPVTLRLALRDALGNAVPGAAVGLTQARPGITIVQAQGVTDAAGEYTAQAVSTVAGPASIVAQAGSAQLTTAITWLAGAIDANQSTWSAALEPLVADGDSASRLVVTARDAYGNPVAGAPVVFGGSLGLAFAPNQGVTDASGTMSTTLTSTRAQSATLTAAFAGITLQKTLSVVAGAPASSTSMLVASPNVLVADGDAAVTLTGFVADAFGNPVEGQQITFAAPGAGLSIAPAVATTGADGRATSTLRGTRPQLVTVTAAVGSTLVSTPVRLVPGPPVLANSTLAAVPSSAVADGVAAVTLQLVVADAQGNVVSGVAVRFDAPDGADTVNPVNVTTDAAGLASAQVTSTKAQQKQLSATFAGLYLTTPATFIPGAPSAQGATLVTNPNVVVADGNAAIALTLRITDAQANPIVGERVLWSALPGGQTLFAPTESTTDAFGVAHAQATSVQAHAETFTAQFGASQKSVPGVFVAGSPNGVTSSLTAAPSQGLADGTTPILLTVRLRDGHNNAIAGTQVLFNALGLGAAVADATVTTDAQGIAQTQLTATYAGTQSVQATAGALSLGANVPFLPGSVSVLRSLLTAAPAQATADGVAAIALSLQALDKLGNPVPGQPCSFAAPTLQPSFVPQSQVTDGNGICRSAMTTTQAGNTQATANVSGASVYTPVTFLPGAPVAQGISLVASPNTVTADGQSSVNLALIVTDAFGNPVPNAQVRLSTTQGATSLLPVQTSTNAQGRATAVATSTQAYLTPITAQITVGQQVLSADVNVLFVPGAISQATSSVTVSPAQVVADGNSVATISLILRDALGNAVAQQNVTVNPVVAQVMVDTPYTDSDGRFTARLRATAAGVLPVTLAYAGGSLNTQVTFLPGSPNAALSSVALTPNTLVADSVTSGAISLRVADVYGNAVPGQVVSWSSPGAATSITPATSVTDSTGRASAAITSTQAQQTQAAGQVNQAQGGVSFALMAPVRFVSGAATAGGLTVAISPNQAVADGVAQVTLTARLADPYGNPVSGAAIGVTASGTGNVGAPAQSSTDGNGIYRVALASTAAQAKAYTVTSGIAAASGQATFVAGSPNALTSQFTGPASQVVADGAAQAIFEVRARDRYNNAVAALPVTYTSSVPSDLLSPAQGSTDGLGNAVVTVAAITSGSRTITASFGGIALSQTTVFVPGNPNGVLSTLSCVPTQLIADGNAQALCRVTARDNRGNLVSGQTVSFASNGSMTQVLPATAVTGADGTASVQVSSVVAQSQTLSANLGTAVLTQALSLTPGPVAPGYVTWVSSPNTVVANGVSIATMQLHLVDAHNNNVAGVPVTFAVSGGNTTLLPQGAVTDAAGNLVATLSASAAGAKQITATAAGVNYTQTVTFVPGAVSTQASSLTAQPQTQVANGQNVVLLTLVARDAQNNAIANQAVSWSSTGGNSIFSATASSTDGNGMTQVTLASTPSEAKVVQAALGASPITVPVLFVAGPASSSTSTLTTNMGVVTADNSSQALLTLTVRDALGNLVPNQAVTFTGLSPNNTLTPSSGTTNAQGSLSVALVSSRAEPRVIVAQFAGGQAQVAVTFVPGSVATGASTWTSNVTSVVADGNARATLTAAFADSLGNPLSGQAVSVTSTGGNVTLAPSAGSTDAAGRFTTAWSSNVAQSKTATITAGAVQLGLTLPFVPGPAVTQTSTLTLAPAAVIADGVAGIDVQLRLRDAFNNAVPQKPVIAVASGTGISWLAQSPNTDGTGLWRGTLAATVAEAKTVTLTAAGLTFSGNVVFSPGPSMAATSTFVVSPNVTLADGVQAQTLTVFVRDAQNNPIANQSVGFAGTGGRNSFSPAVATTDAAGRAQATLLSTLAQTQDVTAAFGAQVLRATSTFVPGPASTATSSLTASPQVLVADGASAASVSLVLQDAQGNPEVGQSVAWSASGTGNIFSQSTGITNAAGVATTQLASNVAQGQNVIAQAMGLTFRVPLTYVAGPASAASSSLVLSPNQAVANGTSPMQAFVRVVDALGNVVAGQNVLLTVSGSANGLSPSQGSTDAAGLFIANLTSTRAEAKTVRVALGTAAGAPSLQAVGQFVPGPASAAKSLLAVAPASVTADGATPIQVSVTVQDAQNNPIVGLPLTFAAAGNQITLVGAAGITGATGISQATLTSVLAQTSTVSVSAPGGFVLSSPISFVAGPASTAASTFVISPNQTVANGVTPSAFTLRLKDAMGNPVAGVAVSFTGAGANVALANSSGVTDAAGLFATTATSTLAQTRNITANFGAASLVRPISFVAGPPSALTSALVAAPASALANGQATIGLQLIALDAFANPIGNLPVSLTTSGQSTAFAATGGNTSGGGTWSTTATSTLAQTQVVTATLGVAAPAAITTSFTFTAGAPVAGSTTFVASPNVVVANNAAQSQLITTVRDAYGNPVPNAAVSVAVTGTSRTLTPASGTTTAAGTFTAALTTSLVQSMTATATPAGLPAMTAAITSVPGPTASLSLAGLAGGIAQVTSTPQVATFDAFGNATPAFSGTIAFASTDAAAVLPQPYTFVAGDLGQASFANGVTLVTPGVHTVTAQVVGNASATGSQSGIAITQPLTQNITVALPSGASQCLRVSNGDMTPGAAVISDTCTSNIAEVLTLSTDNTLRVMGNCVEVAGGTYVQGQPVVANTCTRTPKQRWTLGTNGVWQSVGNSNYCMDFGATASGTQAVIGLCDATKLSQQSTVRGATTRYNMLNGTTSMALEVSGGTLTAGTQLRSNVFVNGVHQAFMANADGSLGIGGLCVAATGGVYTAGTTLTLATCNGSLAQKFILGANALRPQGNSAMCVDLGAFSTPTQATLKTCSGGSGQNIAPSLHGLYYQYRPQVAISQPLCVDVPGGAYTLGTPTSLTPCNGSISQAWALNPNAGPTAQFGFAGCNDTVVGLLNILGLANYNGQQLFLNNCSGSTTQMWRSAPIGGGLIQMQWKATGNYCWNGSATSGAQMVLGTCNVNNSGQIYYQLARAFAVQPATVATSCIDVPQGTPVDGAPLTYATCNGMPSQSMTPTADNALQINGLCVEASGGLTAGAALKLAACSGAANQKWQLNQMGSGLSATAIQSLGSTPLCFDTTVATPGTALKLAACSATQKFTLN